MLEKWSWSEMKDLDKKCRAERENKKNDLREKFNLSIVNSDLNLVLVIKNNDADCKVAELVYKKWLKIIGIDDDTLIVHRLEYKDIDKVKNIKNSIVLIVGLFLPKKTIEEINDNNANFVYINNRSPQHRFDKITRLKCAIIQNDRCLSRLLWEFFENGNPPELIKQLDYKIRHIKHRDMLLSNVIKDGLFYIPDYKLEMLLDYDKTRLEDMWEENLKIEKYLLEKTNEKVQKYLAEKEFIRINNSEPLIVTREIDCKYMELVIDRMFQETGYPIVVNIIEKVGEFDVRFRTRNECYYDDIDWSHVKHNSLQQIYDKDNRVDEVFELQEIFKNDNVLFTYDYLEKLEKTDDIKNALESLSNKDNDNTTIYILFSMLADKLRLDSETFKNFRFKLYGNTTYSKSLKNLLIDYNRYLFIQNNIN